MFNKILYFVVALVVVTGIIRLFINSAEAPDTVLVPENGEAVMCTMDAMECPDGTFVGRTGPNCEFVCGDVEAVPADIQAMIDAKKDLIKITAPVPNGVIGSPLIVTGQARGPWFSEAVFPVTLTNWNGLIIAEGIGMASGNWMTEEFVSFTSTLQFVNPFTVGDLEFMKRGTLILKKDNPSALPEYDDALEIPVRFAE